jgi:hypothetical protein
VTDVPELDVPDVPELDVEATLAEVNFVWVEITTARVMNSTAAPLMTQRRMARTRLRCASSRSDTTDP